MPIYEWEHIPTSRRIEVESSIKDIDKFLETVDDPDNWRRVPQMPNVRTDKLSTSYPDGHVPRSRKKDINDAKEAVKLEIDSYNMKPEKRGGIKKEIKKLREIKK